MTFPPGDIPRDDAPRAAAASARLHGHIARHVTAQEQARLLSALSTLRHHWRAPLVMIDYRPASLTFSDAAVRLLPCRNAAAHMVAAMRALPVDATLPQKSEHAGAEAQRLAARLMSSLLVAWPDYARPVRLIAYSDGHAIAFCSETPGAEWPHMARHPDNANQNGYMDIAPAGSSGDLARLMSDLARNNPDQIVQ